ncbi:MAG: DUF4102 domain-containing protein, partial [Gammaproteobacteria bacterium]|nr:DUF4102 domain-containing protein [Gammaproteobacteria bacterium]
MDLARSIEKLSHTEVLQAEGTDTPYKLFDGAGLYLLVNPNGSRYWRYKYRYQGKEKLLALGVFPTVQIEEARVGRREAKKLLKKGIDPSQARKAEKPRFDPNHEDTSTQVQAAGSLSVSPHHVPNPESQVQSGYVANAGARYQLLFENSHQA